MLKNSKIGYDWIFQIILGYHDLIFLISVVLSLVSVVVVLVVVFLKLENTKGWFFQRVHLYLWAVAGHELSKYKIHCQFMTIHELWNSIIFLNFKTSLMLALQPSPSLWRIGVRKSICDSTNPYTVCFYCMPRSVLLKYYIETKLQTTCFYLI